MLWIINVILVQFYKVYACCLLCRADLDQRRKEKDRLEEERRRETMEKLRKDMEQSRGENVVLSTGLKDNEERSKAMMDEDEDEELDGDEEIITEDEDVIDEDEDDEDSNFPF